MSPSNTDRPADIPDGIIQALEDSSDSQLRELIHYAQGLLGEQQPLTDSIEPRPGEEIIHREDHDSYTYVVVEREDGADKSGGRFAYRVRWEPDLGEGDGGRDRWHYLGEVEA
jgi:hypothetical protein